MTEKEIRLCNTHGSTVFAKHKVGGATHAFRCLKCNTEKVAKVVNAKRERAYKEFGSECMLCGYSKCRAALDWHHLDPTIKDVEPSKVFSRSWENIVDELKKCVILCSNCHREVHAGVRKISLVSSEEEHSPVEG